MPSQIIHAPTVSVLLPVYNAESYLHAAIDSVLAQTFEDFELLVLDDGSTDASLEIIQRYAALDNRILVVSRQNKGIVQTLNELVLESSGQYLARMDADDICLPERFARQVDFMETHVDHVVVGAWVEMMNEKGQPIGIIKVADNHNEIDGNNLKGHSSIWHPTAMIRKEAMTSVGGYNLEYEAAQDLDLWLRLAEIGKIANIPEVQLRFRLSDNSISVTKAKVQQRCAKRACEQAWKRRNIDGKYEPTGHWRAGSDIGSRHTFALQYGWVSWGHGNRKSWWTYARQALLLKPFSVSSWKLLIFGLYKRPTPREGSRK